MANAVYWGSRLYPGAASETDGIGPGISAILRAEDNRPLNRDPVGAKARIFASTSFLTLGVVVNALIGILIARTLARHLGVAGYGQYALAFVFLSFTGVLVNFGFDTILIRELAKDEKHANALLTAGIVLKLLFAAGAVGVGTLYVLSRGFPPAYTGPWPPCSSPISSPRSIPSRSPTRPACAGATWPSPRSAPSSWPWGSS